MKLKRLLSAMLLGGFISSPVFAADSVTLSAGGPGSKETDYTIKYEGTSGSVWTYSVYREAGGRDLSHWSLGTGNCNITNTTGAGAETGNGGSAQADGALAGQPLVKWNTNVSTDPSNPTVFTFTLDGEYASQQVTVVAKTGGQIQTDDGVITGPDCSNPITSAVDTGDDAGSDESAGSDAGSDESAGSDAGSDESAGSDAGSDESAGSDAGSDESTGSDAGSDESVGSDAGSDTASCDVSTDSETLAAGGGDNAFTIEFLGKNGNEWSYKVSETGRELSHWSLGIENCNGHVQTMTGGRGVEQGSGGASDQLLKDTGVDWMVKWDTDGGVGSGEVFTLTLDGDYAATDIGVLVKTGGNPQTNVGTITAPNCAVPAPTDCGDESDSGTVDSGDESDNDTANSGDESDSGTADSGDSNPVVLTCPESENMLGSFNWNGISYILNGDNVGGIAVTGGVAGMSAVGANWTATSGSVSTILVAGSDTSTIESLDDATSGSFSNAGLDSDIASVMFCGTKQEQANLAVALPAQGSIVGRVWALACEADCDEYLAADEVALDDADHVLEVIQPNGQVLFIPVSIMK
jgi:hypothetical protein